MAFHCLPSSRNCLVPKNRVQSRAASVRGRAVPPFHSRSTSDLKTCNRSGVRIVFDQRRAVLALGSHGLDTVPPRERWPVRAVARPNITEYDQPDECSLQLVKHRFMARSSIITVRGEGLLAYVICLSDSRFQLVHGVHADELMESMASAARRSLRQKDEQRVSSWSARDLTSSTPPSSSRNP